MSTIVWTEPRVEVPTKRGLAVLGLRDTRAVILTGPRGARLEPVHLGDALLAPSEGVAYLRALANGTRTRATSQIHAK
jgi:hypothetical protein